jgi:hypothetical protein
MTLYLAKASIGADGGACGGHGYHDDGRPMLGHRLGTGKVDQPAEAVLGVLRRYDLHPIPRVASGQL